MGFTQPAMAQDIWAVTLSGNGKQSAPDKCSLCSASDSPAIPAEIKKIMDKFRGNAPKQFNNTDIAKTEDFLEQTSTTADGVEKLTTPPSNVLKYILADDSWFAVRPSGTEPKIKFYIATVGESEADAKEKIANIEAEINAFVGE